MTPMIFQNAEEEQPILVKNIYHNPDNARQRGPHCNTEATQRKIEKQRRASEASGNTGEPAKKEETKIKRNKPVKNVRKSQRAGSRPSHCARMRMKRGEKRKSGNPKSAVHVQD